MKNLIISGPCSLEGQYQFEETLKKLIQSGIKDIRAGIWKPRTKPGSFEGIGLDGLKIIKDLKYKYDFTSYIEVAEPEHVFLAERYLIDSFWIGSRTTGNPFAVQAIANCVKDKNKNIFIKNPMNYDVDLWAGAIMRFKDKGFKNISVIFRGFNQESCFRNLPAFEAIDELFNVLGYKLPVVIDVSHISGDRALIPQLIAKSKSLNYNNFMIESHINPDLALTDAAQQVKPESVIDLLKSKNLLDYERTIIDSIDQKIISLLEKRIKSVRLIGAIKKTSSIKNLDENRKKIVLKKYGKFKEVYKAIHDYCLNFQNNLL